jgi:hypothetical protein
VLARNIAKSASEALTVPWRRCFAPARWRTRVTSCHGKLDLGSFKRSSKPALRITSSSLRGLFEKAQGHGP